MMLNKAKLECPRCHWIFEMTPPDSEHMVLSLEKPRAERILGDAREVRHTCRNQKCKETFAVYAYMPIDFFSRV